MLKSGKQPVTPPEQKSKDSAICHRCGRGGHKASQCKFLKAKCLSCGKIGHLKRVCKSGNTQGSVKTSEDTGEAVQQQYGLYNVEDATTPRVNPYVVTLTVEGKHLLFEIINLCFYRIVAMHAYNPKAIVIYTKSKTKIWNLKGVEIDHCSKRKETRSSSWLF